MDAEFLRRIELLMHQGRRDEAEAQAQEIMKSAPNSSLALLSEALFLLANYEWEDVIRLARSAEEKSRAIGDMVLTSWACWLRSEARRRLPNHAAALSAAEDAVLAARTAEDKLAEVRALASKSDALRMLYRHKEALQAAEEALQAGRVAGDKPAQGFAHIVKSYALVVMGDDDGALTSAKDAQLIYKTTEDKYCQSWALFAESQALRIRKLFHGALEAAEQALQAAEAAGDEVLRSVILIGKSRALRMLGRGKAALITGRAALETAQAGNYKRGEANALLSICDALFEREHYLDAVATAEQALAAAQAAEDSVVAASALLSKAKALQLSERDKDVLLVAEEANELARQNAGTEVSEAAHGEMLRILEELAAVVAEKSKLPPDEKKRRAPGAEVVSEPEKPRKYTIETHDRPRESATEDGLTAFLTDHKPEHYFVWIKDVAPEKDYRVDNKPVELRGRPLPLAALEHLVKTKGKPIAKATLFDKVYDEEYQADVGFDDKIRHTVSRLRVILRDAGLDEKQLIPDLDQSGDFRWCGEREFCIIRYRVADNDASTG